MSHNEIVSAKTKTIRVKNDNQDEAMISQGNKSHNMVAAKIKIGS